MKYEYNGSCELVSKNLSGLGGPMGTEVITVNFRHFRAKVDIAKKEAEQDYGKPIKWKKTKSRTGLTSGDLHYVEYVITYIDALL